MATLKRLFPYSFNAKKTLGALIINIIVYVVVGAIAGALIGILAGIPIVGLIVGIVGGLIDLYVFVGALLSILHYLKVIK